MAELGPLLRVSVDDLEASLGARRLREYVRACESGFLDRILDISWTVALDERIRAVFISGPTASGKTTFTDRLAGALRMMGRQAMTLSIDDYYLSGSFSQDERGRPDFESFETIDADRMVADLQGLLSGRPTVLPRFDFKTRTRREDPGDPVTASDGTVLLVEGLHGLNGAVMGRLPPETRRGVFIMPYGQLYSDRQLLDWRDIRILRRISRDVRHRGSPALATLDYWPMIDRTEQAMFPAYLAAADEYVNSAMAYEFFVIAPMAGRFLADSLDRYGSGDLRTSWYTAHGGFADIDRAIPEARRLIAAIQSIPPAQPGFVPDISILNEFIR